MKTMMYYCSLFISILLVSMCTKEELSFRNGDIRIDINTGEEWLHDFPLFLGINKKNPPQFAIWIEDTSGNYLSTVFVTYKTATEGWVANNGNRRKESLPHWCHQRGVVYDDGLLLPTKEHPLVDGITGATPRTNKTIKIRPVNLQVPYIIKAEFNHSVDFNSYFPKDAAPKAENYSGGKEGSGQPAVIYSALVDGNTQGVPLELAGHSSPDGSDGNIYTNMEKLTSAKNIVKNITITLL